MALAGVLAAAGILAVAGSAWFAWSRWGAAPPAGQVLFQVAPWGEIESIVAREDGRQVLDAPQATPCVISLPPGDYVVRANNPFYPRPVELTVTVESGRTVRAQAALPDFRLDEEVDRVVEAIR